MIAKGNTLIIDVRDAPEVEKNGKIAGALNVSRGMDRYRLLRIRRTFCNFSGKALKDLGHREVHNLGAFKDWAESGGATEPNKKRPYLKRSPRYAGGLSPS